MAARMTTTLWVRGLKNALICGFGVLVILGTTTVVVDALFQASFREAGLIAFVVFWAVVFSMCVWVFLFGRRAAGPVLLDCGPHPMRFLFLLQAVLFALLTAGGVPFHAFDTIGKFGVAGTFFGITATLWYAAMGLGRLQVREEGLWQYWGLLKWHKIETWEWKSDSECALMLQAKTKFPFLGRGALPVPIEHKEATDALLRANCAGPLGASSPWSS
jgi:hypothetical protein